MHNSVVSSIKYRPTDFDEVIGQRSITSTLERAIVSNRLAPSLLFCGPHGVGKTTCARILARKVNEKEGGGIDHTFNIFELDAASNNSVEDIRNLIDQLRFLPQQGSYKIYIIDEVHMLSTSAFNAFLKTLEEPPAHVIFILATTEKHKILPTILSRCQVYEFRNISVQDIYKKLRQISDIEGIKAEDEALYLIAKRADGALRDALGIFDRLVSFSGKELTVVLVRDQLGILNIDYYFKAIDFILGKDINSLLILFNEVLQEGFDGRRFMSGLTEHIRNLMVSSTNSLLDLTKEIQKKYIQQNAIISENFLIKALLICQRAEIESKESINHRLSIEISLIQLASLS